MFVSQKTQLQFKGCPRLEVSLAFGNPVKYRLLQIGANQTHVHLLTIPKALPLDSQKRKTPELTDVALSRYDRAKWRCLESVVVVPAPDLAAELCSIGVNQIPEASVRGLNLLEQIVVVAEVYLWVSKRGRSS